MLDKLKNMFKKDKIPATVSKEKTSDAKAEATKNKKPYVTVLNVEMKDNNPRNGFFELDWNDYFIVQLKESGYGFDGDPEEEIVDRWFRDIVTQMLAEDGGDPTRTGYININPIDKDKSEVS